MPCAMPFFYALSTRSAEFNSRPIHAGVLVNKAEVGQLFIQIHFFFFAILFPYRHNVIFAIDSIVK
jgi:hypothetical protein